MKDFSFQGKVYLGTRLAGGKPGALTWVGDAPKCDVSMKTETEDRTESFSGQRLQSARLRKKSTAELTLTLNYFDKTTLALGLYANVTTVAGGTVTAEELPDDLAVGDSVVLAKPVASGLVLTDSTGSPVTLVAGTHYTVDPNNASVITIKSLTGLTQPIKAAYTSAALESAAMFSVAPPERYFYLDGINTVTGERVAAHLYRVQFDPADTIPLINDSFGELSLKGAALYDAEAALDPAIGGFGRFELPAAA